jgi:hypothetical protein
VVIILFTQGLLKGVFDSKDVALILWKKETIEVLSLWEYGRL